jgi:hypothetical protein
VFLLLPEAQFVEQLEAVLVLDEEVVHLPVGPLYLAVAVLAGVRVDVYE